MGKPKARQFAISRELGDGLVVVDDARNVAHRLDAQAAAVWHACDGGSTTADIAASCGVSVTRTEELLSELDDRGLLAGTATRRAVLRRAVMTGAAVGAAPAIASVLLPTPEAAFASTPADNTTQGTSGSANSSNPTAPDDLDASSGPPTPGRPTAEGAPTADGGPDIVAGARDRRPIRVAGSGGSPGTGLGTTALGGDELPFTGTNVARTAVVGAAMVGAGAAGHAWLRRSDQAPPAA